MKFFDTAFYDFDGEANSDKFMAENLAIQKFDLDYERRVRNIPNPSSFTGDLLNDFRQEIEEFKPGVIMASAMESTVSLALYMLGSVRDLGLPHVLGGVFATFATETAINFKEIDIVCRGEGENVIVPLVKRMMDGQNLNGLPGIWFKQQDGEIIKGPLAAPVNLDHAPRFDITPFHEKRFYRAMAGKTYRMFPVETHRGCPLQCSFCNSPIQNTLYKEELGAKYFRMKSIPQVMEDVRYFIEECSAEYLFFWADNLLAYPKAQVDEFVEAYSEYKVPFFIQSYPTTLNPYKIKRFAEVGLSRLTMGVEHGNEEFRSKIVNRTYSNQKAIDCVQILKDLPIEYSLNNIVGFPTETPQLHMDTVELNRSLDAHSSGCSIFTPFHGTYLRKLSIERGYLKDPNILAPTDTEQSILDMPEFPKEKIYGKSRTFNLYLKFPKNRWKDIEKAEEISTEGNRIWNELKGEYESMWSSKETTMSLM